MGARDVKMALKHDWMRYCWKYSNFMVKSSLNFRRPSYISVKNYMCNTSLVMVSGNIKFQVMDKMVKV